MDRHVRIDDVREQIFGAEMVEPEEIRADPIPDLSAAVAHLASLEEDLEACLRIAPFRQGGEQVVDCLFPIRVFVVVEELEGAFAKGGVWFADEFASLFEIEIQLRKEHVAAFERGDQGFVVRPLVDQKRDDGRTNGRIDGPPATDAVPRQAVDRGNA